MILKQITGYGVHKCHRSYRMPLLKDLKINPRTGKQKYYVAGNSPEIQKKRNQKSNPKNNPRRMYVNGKHISTKHPLYKPGRYKTFSDAAFDGTYKLDSIKEGYVYAITNPAWPGWVKIGMAIDADDRCNGYQTSSPFRDYTLEHMIVTNDRRAAEAEAHKLANKMAVETRGEWFKLNIEQAKSILDKCSVTQDLFSYAKTGT